MTPIQKPDLPAPSPLDLADPFYAPEAVRARIHRRWERRRAETDGVTQAGSRWIVIGRYTYAHPWGMMDLTGYEVDCFRGGREHLVWVQSVPAHLVVP